MEADILFFYFTPLPFAISKPTLYFIYWLSKEMSFDFIKLNQRLY